MCLDGKSWQHLIAIGIRLHQRAIGVELLPPHQTSLATLLNDGLKEAPEAVDAVTLTNAGHTRMIGEGLVEVVPDIPAHTQPIRSNPLKLPFRAHALKEHDQLELEEHHRVDRGSASCGRAVAHQI